MIDCCNECRILCNKALFGAFGEVNKFIQQAKTSTGAVSESGQPQRRVLIFGREGLGSDQVRCACAQYLMVDCNMKLIKALNVLQAKSKGIISFSLFLNFQIKKIIYYHINLEFKLTF